MTTNDLKDILKEAIIHNGAVMQMIVAMEEMSELTKELSKSIRGFENRDALIEEVADVHIMLMEIELIHNISEKELYEKVEMKALRLKVRLDNNESV
jgi:hypothetical protein